MANSVNSKPLLVLLVVSLSLNGSWAPEPGALLLCFPAGLNEHEIPRQPIYVTPQQQYVRYETCLSAPTMTEKEMDREITKRVIDIINADKKTAPVTVDPSPLVAPPEPFKLNQFTIRYCYSKKKNQQELRRKCRSIWKKKNQSKKKRGVNFSNRE